MVTLGMLVKDQITGYTGIATARATYLYGCNRVKITMQKLGKEKNTLLEEWFDENGVVEIGEGVKGKVKVGKIPTGGPNRYEPKRKGLL